MSSSGKGDETFSRQTGVGKGVPIFKMPVGLVYKIKHFDVRRGETDTHREKQSLRWGTGERAMEGQAPSGTTYNILYDL